MRKKLKPIFIVRYIKDPLASNFRQNTQETKFFNASFQRKLQSIYNETGFIVN